MRQKNESEFAVRIAAWLREQGYEIFSEVPYDGMGGRRIDIVAKAGVEFWAVEVKMSPGLAVLEQAHHWKNEFHKSFVAVPQKWRWREESVFLKCAEALGVGVIAQRNNFSHDPNRFPPEFLLMPQSCEKPDCLGKEFLHPLMAENTPGTQGGHFTPFRHMCDQIKEWLKDHPEGARHENIKELLAENYRNTKTGFYSLKQWIQYGKVKGLRMGVDTKSRWVILLD